MAITDTYVVTVLLDVNETQEVDDRAESRSYIVANRNSGQAIIIDAVIENVERDLRITKELGFTLLFAIETHIHADHITGASLIKERTGAQIVYGGGAKGVVTGVDQFLFEDEALRFGNTVLTALATPGHTDGCTSYVLPGAVFTGDVLFIRGNGRTDLQGGSAEKLFDSVRKKLFTCRTTRLSIPGMIIRAGCPPRSARRSNSTKRLNLSINKGTFVEIMNRRNTPVP
jgi:glyoxylase-like metal-dependent hydrolase (beta-lactamase superfamily II)